MNRYIIKFTKEGYLKYISHLDLMRLFDRTLKRAGIRLAYSHGFNPHPKMSIAQPLPLGFKSTGEYIEIETAQSMDAFEIQKLLQEHLPEGIRLLKSGKAPEGSKTLAALVEYGRYTAAVTIGDQVIPLNTDEFLQRQEINMLKFQKKTGKETVVNIRPQIYAFSCAENNGKLILDMVVSTGSASNLNPELLIESFLNHHGIAAEKHQYDITRIDLYFLKDDLLFSLDSLMI